MSFNFQNYQFSVGEYEGQNVIFVQFPYNLQFKNDLRVKFMVARWSVSQKIWYLPDTTAIKKELGMIHRTEPGKAVISHIYPVNQKLFKFVHEINLCLLLSDFFCPLTKA